MSLDVDGNFGSGEYKSLPHSVKDDIINVVIGDGVTSIGVKAFDFCFSLANIEIPDSVTSIGYDAFRDCSSLRSIEIPDSVTFIGDCAFYNCESLTNIKIPDSVTTIRESAFFSCISLKTITFSGTEEQWNALGLKSNDINYATVTFAK